MAEEPLSFWESVETVHPKHFGTIFMSVGALKMAFGVKILLEILRDVAPPLVPEAPLLPEADFAPLAWLALLLLLPGASMFIAGVAIYFRVRKKPAYWWPFSTSDEQELLSHLSRKERARALTRGMPLHLLALSFGFAGFYALGHENDLAFLVCAILSGVLLGLGRHRQLKALCSTPYARERQLTPKLLRKRVKGSTHTQER